MQENGFWDDVKRAEEVTKECKIIKDKIITNIIITCPPFLLLFRMFLL